MSSMRRRSDPEDADFTGDRRFVVLSRLNGHTKWVVGFVSTAIVATLGTFIMLDRNQMDAKASTALSTAASNSTQIAVMVERLGNIQRSLEEIKTTLKDEDSIRKNRQRP